MDIDRALLFHLENIRRRYFLRWRTYKRRKAAQEERTRVLYRRVISMHIQGCLRRSIGAWKTYTFTIARGQANTAARHFSKTLMRAALKSLHALAIRSRTDSLRADAFYYEMRLPLTRNIFTVWRTIVRLANDERIVKTFIAQSNLARLKATLLVLSQLHRNILRIREASMSKMYTADSALTRDCFLALVDAYRERTRKKDNLKRAFAHYQHNKQARLLTYLLRVSLDSLKAQDAKSAESAAAIARNQELGRIKADRLLVYNTVFTRSTSTKTVHSVASSDVAVEKEPTYRQHVATRQISDTTLGLKARRLPPREVSSSGNDNVYTSNSRRRNITDTSAAAAHLIQSSSSLSSRAIGEIEDTSRANIVAMSQNEILLIEDCAKEYTKSLTHLKRCEEDLASLHELECSLRRQLQTTQFPATTSLELESVLFRLHEAESDLLTHQQKTDQLRPLLQHYKSMMLDSARY